MIKGKTDFLHAHFIILRRKTSFHEQISRKENLILPNRNGNEEERVQERVIPIFLTLVLVK
jgi:hypothetical protein